MDRRHFLTGSAGAAALVAQSATLLAQAPAPAAPAGTAPGAPPAAPAPAAPPPPPPAFTLPPLGYEYSALEPFIDTATMRIHHSGHHQAFITALNTLANQWDGLRSTPMDVILGDLNQVPEPQRMGVRNNLGGHFNHSFFWQLMTPGGAKQPGAELVSAMQGTVGSTVDLVTKLNQAAATRFGSGWAWLVVNKDKQLEVLATPYQDTPLELGAKPVIGVDVWEHAYYLKHQNRRADYLAAWWNTVNWDKANENFRKAMG